MRFVLAVAFCSGTLTVGLSNAADTPHDQVVSEFIRQLATMQDVYDANARDVSTSKNKLLDGIRGSTRIKLELGVSINMLQPMNLAPPYETLLPTVMQVYQRKIELHDRLIAIATQFVGGSPKPGVDYGQLTAEAPQITATLEQADKVLFQTTPMFCFLLVHDKTDKEGHLSHLNINKARRSELVKQIDISFGRHLKDKAPNYTISAALVIRDFLVGEHKSADDPW
jgi:hypothetical protein